MLTSKTIYCVKGTDIHTNSGEFLPVMEHFYTLQGEGMHTGKAAYFIRLAGCDVGCVWCDVKESWDASKHPVLPIDELVNEAEKSGTKIVVITGGEPLLYNLTPLTQALQTKGIATNIETSGSSPLSGEWDWICLSPKKFKAPLPECIAAAHELKVVVYHPSDFAWAEQFAQQTNPNCKLYLQVEWSKKDTLSEAITNYIKANPQWQLSMQVHKYLNIP